MNLIRGLSAFCSKTVDNLKIYLINLNSKFKFIIHDDMHCHEQSNDWIV